MYARFSAYWDPAAFVLNGQPEAIEVTLEFFNEDNGYEAEEREAIEALEIDGVWQCPDYGPYHTVQRLQ